MILCPPCMPGLESCEARRRKVGARRRLQRGDTEDVETRCFADGAAMYDVAREHTRADHRRTSTLLV